MNLIFTVGMAHTVWLDILIKVHPILEMNFLIISMENDEKKYPHQAKLNAHKKTWAENLFS